MSGFAYFRYRPFHCPFCRSSPRERFVHYSMDHGLLPAIPAGARILHLAPTERGLAHRLRGHGEYVAGDLEPCRYGEGDVRHVDVTSMQFEHRFDLIYAAHVLEHVQDDRRAMRSLRAHLTRRGVAWILVPVLGETTEEGGPDLSSEARRHRFGHPEHVRQYGLDIVDRLREEGFLVSVVDAGNLEPATVALHGFETHGYRGDPECDRIFVCRPVRP